MSDSTNDLNSIEVDSNQSVVSIMKTLTFGLGLTLITANYLCPKGGRLEEVRLDLKLISQVYA